MNAHTDDRPAAIETGEIGPAGEAGPLAELDRLVTEWLTLPDVAELLGIDVGDVRRLLQDRDLLVTRRGEASADPAAAPLVGGLRCRAPRTLTVLADPGYDAEAPCADCHHDSLPGTPVDALRAGRKTEVRRRAQALAFSPTAPSLSIQRWRRSGDGDPPVLGRRAARARRAAGSATASRRLFGTRRGLAAPGSRRVLDLVQDAAVQREAVRRQARLVGFSMSMPGRGA